LARIDGNDQLHRFSWSVLKSEWEKDDCTSRNSAAWCILHAFDPKADENYGIKDAMFSGDFRIAGAVWLCWNVRRCSQDRWLRKILAGKDTFMKHGGVGGTALFLMAMSDGRIYPRMRGQHAHLFLVAN
jgi:hypothetical protein